MASVGFLLNVKVRELPTVQGRVLKLALAGELGTLLTLAPVWSDGLAWWKVRHSDGVEGWSAQSTGEETLLHIGKTEFDRSIEFTLAWEGGYVNNPNDPGGETKYGISKRSYPEVDIRNLTLDEAKRIYYEDYWLKIGAYTYTLPKCTILLDIGVISGVGRASALRELSINGILASQLQFYAALANFTYFGRGWVRRTAALLTLTQRREYVD